MFIVYRDFGIFRSLDAARGIEIRAREAGKERLFYWRRRDAETRFARKHIYLSRVQLPNHDHNGGGKRAQLHTEHHLLLLHLQGKCTRNGGGQG